MSPIQNKFSETVDGLTSIRAFGLQRPEAQSLSSLIDGNSMVYIMGRMADKVSDVSCHGCAASQA